MKNHCAFRPVADVTWPKQCRNCGELHSYEAWLALPFRGVQELEMPDGEPTRYFEQKNCPCDSTLGVEVAIDVRRVA